MKKSIYSEEYKYLVRQLKKARKDARLDQSQVAELLSTTQSSISRIEAGQIRIDPIQLNEFAKIYNKKLNWFVKQ